jgi:hyperosmotically inducible protein
MVAVWLATPALAADVPDAWITMKTRIALITADDVNAADLNVDTVKGVVTLHGKVPAESGKRKAERLAAKIEGVKSVKNLLQIVPAVRREVAQRSDDEVKTAVEAAFKANRQVADSGITVASVNKGVVLLAGKADSLEAHLEAIQVANAVKGVRRVSSEVVDGALPESGRPSVCATIALETVAIGLQRFGRRALERARDHDFDLRHHAAARAREPHGDPGPDVAERIQRTVRAVVRRVGAQVVRRHRELVRLHVVQPADRVAAATGQTRVGGSDEVELIEVSRADVQIVRDGEVLQPPARVADFKRDARQDLLLQRDADLPV